MPAAVQPAMRRERVIGHVAGVEAGVLGGTRDLGDGHLGHELGGAIDAFGGQRDGVAHGHRFGFGARKVKMRRDRGGVDCTALTVVMTTLRSFSRRALPRSYVPNSSRRLGWTSTRRRSFQRRRMVTFVWLAPPAMPTDARQRTRPPVQSTTVPARTALTTRRMARTTSAGWSSWMSSALRLAMT